MSLLLRLLTLMVLIAASVEWVMLSWHRPSFVPSVMVSAIAIAAGSLLCLWQVVAVPKQGA